MRRLAGKAKRKRPQSKETKTAKGNMSTTEEARGVLCVGGNSTKKQKGAQSSIALILHRLSSPHGSLVLEHKVLPSSDGRILGRVLLILRGTHTTIPPRGD